MKRALQFASLAVTGVVGLAFGPSCYATTYDCYYYYGYYYPYCGYSYYESYTPADGYEPVVYQEMEAVETPHPDPTIEPRVSDESVQAESYVYVHRAEDEGDNDAADILNKDYPCGRGEYGLVLCTDDDEPARDTDYIVIVLELEQAVAIDHDSDTLILGFAFDSDNDPDNNFIPPEELANDYFGLTDRWYAARYTPDDGWELEVFRMEDGSPVEDDSDARVILQETSAALIVPADEFEEEIPGSRVSLFRYDTEEGMSGDDWSAFVFPPLGEPLAGR